MIAERRLHTGSKPAMAGIWHAAMPAEELSAEDAGGDDLCDAMDRLPDRQAQIEIRLAAKRLSDGAMALSGVTGSHHQGKKCPPAQCGHDRDGKKGRPL